MSNPPTPTIEDLDVNELEAIIRDHNKAMRTDMASEITGGSRSAAITDVITVKAIVHWYEKQSALLITKAEQNARIDEYENHFPHRKIKKNVWAVTESDIKERIAQLKATTQKEGSNE